MIGSQVRRDHARMRRFVVLALVEADREGAHRPRAVGLHQRGDRGRVDAPGQQHAEWHVGDHLPAHGISQVLLQRVERLGLAALERVRHATLGDLGQRPVCDRLGLALPGRKPQPGARRQLADAGMDRIRRRDVVVTQQQRERASVDGGVECRMRAQRLQFRAKQEGLALPAVVQRLLA